MSVCDPTFVSKRRFGMRCSSLLCLSFCCLKVSGFQRCPFGPVCVCVCMCVCVCVCACVCVCVCECESESARRSPLIVLVTPLTIHCPSDTFDSFSSVAELVAALLKTSDVGGLNRAITDESLHTQIRLSLVGSEMCIRDRCVCVRVCVCACACFASS